MTNLHFSNRALLALGVATGALFSTAPAFAQATTTPVAAADVLDEIVVVARKRVERLVDVPIAITALSGEDVSKLQANDLSGIQGAVPNLNIVQGRGSASSANIFIRGIGQPDALQTFDPAVGVYVDGVYMSRIQGALFNLGDVERIEVLRGPQGTLYGKNTIGGAVNIISRKPDLGAMHASASVTYGSYNQLLLNGYVTVPLITDKLALSVAALWDKRDGLVTDPLTSKKYNDRNSATVRAILRAKPTDRIELVLAGDYTRQRTALTLGYPTAPILQTSLFPAGVTTIVPAQPYGPYAYKASTSFKNGEGQRLDHWGVSLTANLELSDIFSLTSITAYRNLKPDFFVDIDASQAKIGDVFVGVRQHQFSQEAQLKWDMPRFKGVFGLYYLQESVASHQEAYADDLFTFIGGPVSFTRFIDDKQVTRSYAAFGQATYDLTDKLSVTAGLRYTHETRSYDRFTTTSSNQAFLNNISFAFPDNLPAPLNGTNSASFDAWTPSATLSYKPTRDTLLYVTAGRGFKSGGFNGRANSLADLTLVVNGVPTLVTRFKPETVWTYEAGAKGNFLDGRVRLSGDFFYSDYKDFQARVGGGVVGSTGVFPVINAGKLRIWGFEGEAAVRPATNWNVRVAVGYLNAQYLEFNDGRRVPPSAFSCNPTGNAIVCKPAFAPPLTLTLGSDYTIPLGNNAGAVTLGGDARFIDKQYLSVDNRPGLTENGYWLANAYVQYDAPGGRWYVRGAVKNLGKALYKTDGQEFSSVGNIQTVYYGDPRTWTGTIGLRF